MRYRFLQCIIAILFLYPLFLSPVSGETGEVNIEKALKAREEGRFEESGELLLKAAEEYAAENRIDGQAQLTFYAGRAFLMGGNGEAGPLTDRGLETFTKAGELYQSIQRIDKVAEIKIEQGMRLRVLFRHEEAEVVLMEALSLCEELGPEADKIRYFGYRHLAGVIDESQRWDQALALYRTTIELAAKVEPKDVPEHQVTLAALYQLLGEDEAALRTYEIAAQGYKSYGKRDKVLEVKGRIAAMLTQRERYREALPIWLSLAEAYGEKDKAIRPILKISVVYEGLGEFQKALDILTQVRGRIDNEAQRENLDAQRVKLLWRLGKDEKARELLASDIFRTNYRRARIAGQADQEELTWEYYDRYLSEIPKSERPLTLNSMAVQAMTWNQSVKAEGYLKEALALVSEKDEATQATLRVNLGESFIKRGEPAKAIEYLNMALPWYESLNDGPKLAVVLNNLAACHSSLGNLAKANLDLERAVDAASRYTKPDPIQGTVINALGFCRVQLGRFKEGIRLYRRALAMHQARGELGRARVVRFNLGAALILDGQREEGFKLLTDVAEQANASSDTELTTLILGFYAMELSDADRRRRMVEAADVLLPFVEDKRARGVILNAKAQLDFEEGKFDQARANAQHR